MSTSIGSTTENNISQTDYLKLFMQELSYQDPLKPLDNREFMAQMAQFSALQEARATNEALQLLLNISSGNQSLFLLGKRVRMHGSDSEGEVLDVQFPVGAPLQLEIGMHGSRIKKELKDISEIIG